jgi:hypothetical protein
MVAMPVLWGTIIRYTYLLIHLVGGDLAHGAEDGGKTFGLYSMVLQISLVCKCCIFDVRRFGSIQEFSGDDFGSRHLSLGACVRRLSDVFNNDRLTLVGDSSARQRLVQEPRCKF